ncbi:hypothetical protein OCS_06810 [Ophiocordyceps sinensis CO18]|uniref:Uncharacterized protein n=1 Tax=Ophiocordyceps sinensis (strain Co18 / CGMCC 3.14243) TaxID=911162 RepID=T5A6N3_OPHSC|nr:hypothetical protein OCS_06810 [Ophiocordyceps sinensis CO18]
MAANGQPRSLEAMRPGGSARSARQGSESPARSARFAPAPDQLLVRHEPPPRSVSPKKSAMKLSSQRDASLSDDDSETSARRRSPHGQDDVVIARKKSARVSWDDNSTVVVGESVQPHDTESPLVPSPQAKKPWHSIVTKYAKKEPVNLSRAETMSPRPALPLFGSVREKKPRDHEERPLVRPLERTRSPPAPEPSETSPGPGIGQSSDAAVGAALSQEQASRNAANISKYREPLPVSMPPGESSAKESTFVESSSDDDLDTDVTTEPEDSMEPTPSKTPASPTPEPEPEPQVCPDEADAPKAKLDGESAPTISVSLPSPGLEKPSDYRGEGPEMPGRFPDDDDFADGDHIPDIGIAVEVVSQDAAAPTSLRPLESPSAASNAAMEDIKEEEEESDRYSIYSDAYEDLDEVDGDGFLSLDAVVESSADAKTPTSSREQAATNLLDDPRQRTDSPAPSTQGRASPEPAKDWENAKAYWKSLSADQRRLLEVEALFDDSDDEEDDGPRRAKQGRKRQATTGPLKETWQPCQELNQRSYQIKPGTQWSDDASSARRAPAPAGQPGKAVPKIRHSMRGEQPASARAVHEQQPGAMRKSMRSGGPAPATAPDAKPRRPEMDTDAAASAAGAEMRKSFRDGRGGSAARPSLSQTDRPASYHPPETPKPHKVRKRNLSVEDLGARGNMKPGLGRRGSDDSVSSFTRSRASPGSRFADSSDEDEGGPSFFSSRFVDSSDDEDVPRRQPRGKGMARSLRGANRSASMGAPGSAGVMPASRGITSPDHLRGNGATAQPKRAALGVEQSSLHRSGSGRGTLTPLPAAQGEDATRPRPRRGSIMSILRRRKDPSRISRDVRPERSPGEQSVTGSDSHHTRGPSWPLPDAEAGGQGIAVDKARPSTAGGPVSASKARTVALHRRSTSLGTSVPGGGADDDGGQSGADVAPLKKKKFGALRKMFGIHD